MAPTASAPDRPPALRGTGLRHSYGTLPVLRGADLTLARGECVALLGPNGAGKTTLIRILATLLRPSAGSLAIDDVDARRDPVRARSLVGMAGDRTLLSADLTPRENLRFYGRVYGVSHLDRAIEAALDQMGAASLADRPVRSLSRGMQQRVSLARAILHDPLVLLLDEPETALDEAAQKCLTTILRERVSAGAVALVVSHRADWTRTFVDRTVHLQDGTIALNNEPLSLGARSEGEASL